MSEGFPRTGRRARPFLAVSPPDACRGDIRLRGVLADILSNALRNDFEIHASARALRGGGRDTRGEPLFQEVVAKYTLDPDKLKGVLPALVEGVTPLRDDEDLPADFTL